MNNNKELIFLKKYDKNRNNKIIESNLNESNTYISKDIFLQKLDKEKNDNQIIFLKKKTPRFEVKKEEKKKRNSINNFDTSINEGKWTKEENDLFLDAIDLYGINLEKINSIIKTRSLAQIKYHMRQVFLKLKMCKEETLGIDFTSEQICNIKDMITYVGLIKKKRPNDFDY